MSRLGILGVGAFLHRDKEPIVSTLLGESWDLVSRVISTLIGGSLSNCIYSCPN